MSLGITDETIKAAVVKVIYETIPEEEKRALLEKTIAKIVEPKERGDYRNRRTTSMLEEAFSNVVWSVTNQFVIDELKKPEWQEKIRALFVESMGRVFDDEEQRAKVTERIGRQFSECIKPSYE